MRTLLEKGREVVFSVLPIYVIVWLLSLTVTPFGAATFARFSIGALLCIIGLTLFLVSVDKGVSPLGGVIGETMIKSGKLLFLLLTTLVIGFFISVAEPGLFIFSNQVERITQGYIGSGLLLSVVSLGLALLLAFALYRIVSDIKLRTVLLILYFIIFVLSFFSTPELLVIAFDASGSTTGVLAVPFILALAYGTAHLKKRSILSDSDSFGTIAIVSAGAIIAVLGLSLFKSDSGFSTQLKTHVPEDSALFMPFIDASWGVMLETMMVIAPLVAILFLFQFLFLRTSIHRFVGLLRGFVYAFFGLFLFLLGVNAGFMDVGALLGHTLADEGRVVLTIMVAFAIGVGVVLAEPAVNVLTHQIEDATSGFVSRRSVLVSLALGVGIALSLAMLRVFVEPLQIWHYLLPGYILAVVLMYFIPDVFVGMAWDAGGVATGPVTATFVLAFVQGAAEAAPGADVILDGFGMIAMVALMPILTLQCLGLLFRIKSKKEDNEDGETAGT